MVKNDPNHPVMFYNATDEDMEKAIAHPSTIVGSDAFPFTDPKTGKLTVDVKGAPTKIHGTITITPQPAHGPDLPAY